MKHIFNNRTVFTKKHRLHNEILMTLLKMVSHLEENTIPPPSKWPTTRQIADAHDISIYKARLLLLELVKQGRVVVSNLPVSNSLRWYPYNSMLSVSASVDNEHS